MVKMSDAMSRRQRTGQAFDPQGFDEADKSFPRCIRTSHWHPNTSDLPFYHEY